MGVCRVLDPPPRAPPSLQLAPVDLERAGGAWGPPRQAPAPGLQRQQGLGSYAAELPPLLLTTSPPPCLPQNFPGAYVVQLMTVVASSACLYTMYRFSTSNADVHWSKELKHDELAESKRWAEQAQNHRGGFFRFLAETRDRAVRRRAGGRKGGRSGDRVGMASSSMRDAVAHRSCQPLEVEAAWCMAPLQCTALILLTPPSPTHPPPTPFCPQEPGKDTRIFRF